jgi:hypothetical protein
VAQLWRVGGPEPVVSAPISTPGTGAGPQRACGLDGLPTGHRSILPAMSVSNGTDSASKRFKLTLKGPGVTIETDVDVTTATEVAALAMGGSTAITTTGASQRTAGPRRRRTGAGSSGTGPEPKTRTRRKSGAPGIVKDLSLRPNGKAAFAAFAAEKKPKTNEQKSVLSAYWLRHEAGLTSGITVDHINTCYVEANWPRPTDLANSLAVTAKRKGWLDTSNLSDIKITTRGEDEVRHKLPPPPKKK